MTPHPPVLSLSVGLAVSVLLLGLGLFILLRHRNRTKHAPVAAPSSNRMNTDTGNTGGIPKQQHPYCRLYRVLHCAVPLIPL
ncbi:hypothetical protein AGOR_G00179220 [Albula goreensis]|uniref:Uncharacterized protein n=1 Tax=Albula goreensis TaxID=1534307 RepID=A0A8T3CYT5_9TELE|nr:hypothetical protein AGOR_G00179220 [Albula goreensis]